MSEYRFSVIVSVFNAEAYLEEALESVVHQTFDFERAVQLILVNDGSTDGSAAICERYAQRYPDNVVLVDKPNGGVASAKNAGLDHATGRIIAFLDADDRYARSTLMQVSKFFRDAKWFVDFVCVPIVYFEGKTGLHPLFKRFKEGENRIVDVRRDPSCLVFSNAASFYKSEVFEGFRFDEGLSIAEDMDLNIRLMQKRKTFGYVSAHQARYCYRKRESGTSLMNLSKSDPKSLESVAGVLEARFPEGRELMEFEKEAIAYQCAVWVPRLKDVEFDDEGERERVASRFRALLSRLSCDFLWTRSKSLRFIAQRVLLLRFSGREYADLVREGFIGVNRACVRLVGLSVEDDNVKLTLSYASWGFDELEPVIIFKGKARRPVHASDGNGAYDKMFADEVVDVTHLREFEFPLEEGRMRFALRDRRTKVYYQAYRLTLDIESSSDGEGSVRCVEAGGFRFAFAETACSVTSARAPGEMPE